MRIFLALRVSETARLRLGSLGPALRQVAEHPRGLRLVPPDNFHLTLKFLGNTEADALARLVEALRHVATQTPLPRPQICGLGAFPSVARAQTLFARVEGTSALGVLMNAVEACAVALGIASEDKPRVPHVTLARLRHRIPGPRLAAFIGDHAGENLGAVDTSALVVYRSDLSPNGSSYTALSQLPIGTHAPQPPRSPEKI